jgi:uncharacterized protein
MRYRTPGVYPVDVFPAPVAELRTGVPAFLGYTTKSTDSVVQLTLLTQFAEQLGEAAPLSYLGLAVRGFFENGGTLCYVVALDEALTPLAAIQQGLNNLSPLHDLDLICAPDLMRPGTDGNLAASGVQAMQAALLDYCDRRGDCFAILDSLPAIDHRLVLQQRQGLHGTNGALYYPWIKVQSDSNLTGTFIPPCGHVAGVYARSDQRTGVHKAPANEMLEGVLDLERGMTDTEQGELNPEGINCLRAFPGRGIRVWGARTLSNDPAWIYVSVRRLFITAGRWIERNMNGLTFEPNDASLWVRVERELTVYFEGLFQRGALQGSTAKEAFYVKCNAETNPPEAREVGTVITEIGLAPSAPNEFIIVRIVHGASGVSITGPNRPL